MVTIPNNAPLTVKMADSSSDINDQEGEKVAEGEKSEPSTSGQPTTATEENQSAEQGPPEKDTIAEQPTDIEKEGEGTKAQVEAATEDQSAAREGEEGVKVQQEEEADIEESHNDKPSVSDTEQQSLAKEATTTGDEEIAEAAGEEASNKGQAMPSEEGEGEGERGGEKDGEKVEEPSIDMQKKDDQVGGGGEAAKSEDRTKTEDESSIKDGVQLAGEDGEQEAEASQQPRKQGEEAEERANVEREEPAPTGEESGVIGMGVFNEPLADILEEDEEQEPIDREELLAATKEVLLEQERLKSVSAQLQHKIAEYLAKKKTEERPDPGRNVTDQEKRYNQCMAALEMYESDLDTMQQRAEVQDAQLLTLREQKLAEVRKAAEDFAEYKKGIATTAVHSRTGRRLQAQEVEQFQAAEDKKESELTLVRLENIKLQNKISKLESQIKEKEQLAEGLHMIDFEQLKINNVDLNEKIEERNEDILKLRKKVTSTVQVLTHVKEKLQFLQAENGEKRAALKNIDEVVAKKRDHLTRMKQARDALRVDNNRLKQKGGLVSHPSLLGDFEERKDQNDELRVVLEKLQQRHSELTIACDGFRKKVEQAKTIHPRNL